MLHNNIEAKSINGFAFFYFNTIRQPIQKNFFLKIHPPEIFPGMSRRMLRRNAIQSGTSGEQNPLFYFFNLIQFNQQTKTTTINKQKKFFKQIKNFSLFQKCNYLFARRALSQCTPIFTLQRTKAKKFQRFNTLKF